MWLAWYLRYPSKYLLTKWFGSNYVLYSSHLFRLLSPLHLEGSLSPSKHLSPHLPHIPPQRPTANIPISKMVPCTLFFLCDFGLLIKTCSVPALIRKILSNSPSTLHVGSMLHLVRARTDKTSIVSLNKDQRVFGYSLVESFLKKKKDLLA